MKRGGVLNIVRRKVELKCPSENIPSELVVDLDGVDIGHSFKISSIKLPENVEPTIRGRDFVIATVAAPTVIKEPEKPAEAEEEQKVRKQLLQLVKELQKLVMQKMLKGLRVRKKKLIKKRTQKKVSLKKNNLQLKNLIK